MTILFHVFILSTIKKDCRSFSKSIFDVTGYDQFRQDLNERSGGLLVFVRDDLARRRLTDIEINISGFETICIEISIGKQKTIFACVYKHRFMSFLWLWNGSVSLW